LTRVIFKPLYIGGLGANFSRQFIGEIMTNDEIRALYDSKLNMTLKELSAITGLNTQELFFILTCEG
jgi:hypothetical protein